MTQSPCTPIAIGPELLPKPDPKYKDPTSDLSGQDYTFLIRSYSLDSASSQHSHSDPDASAYINCYDSTTTKNDHAYLRIAFVENKAFRAPKYKPTDKDRAHHFEIYMHMSMIPMVLRQLDIPGCMFTFQAQVSTNTPHARIDTLPTSKAYCLDPS